MNSEIHIFRGDPGKGHDGFMFSITVGRVYIAPSDTFESRGGAALAAAELIDTVIKHVDKHPYYSWDKRAVWTRVSLERIHNKLGFAEANR